MKTTYRAKIVFDAPSLADFSDCDEGKVYFTWKNMADIINHKKVKIEMVLNYYSSGDIEPTIIISEQ